MCNCLLQVNGFGKFVVCICVIDVKMVEELWFCFVFLMFFNDGGLSKDASMADFEEGLSTERIKRQAFENLAFVSNLGRSFVW